MSVSELQPRVLIVDDDAMVRLLARRALEGSGCEVEEAVDGEASLEQFVRCKPDLVLMDVVMPRMDGFESCRQLRSLASGQHVPVLMMTASNDVESIHRAFDAGATDFISKPLPWALLGYRVRYMLRTAHVMQKLALSEERLSTAQRVARLGYWEWDISTDRVVLSSMSRDLMGHADSVVYALEDLLLGIERDDRERVRIALRTSAASAQPISIEFRAAATESDAAASAIERWMHIQGSVSTPDGPGAVFHGTLQDISEIKRSEAQTRYLAYFDTLTGLPNRVSLHEQLEQWLSASRRHGRTLAVLMLDLDNFKQINETMGHVAGDRLLMLIATRLRNCVRAEDTVSSLRGAAPPDTALARMGGDEFAVLLSELSNVSDADRIARRLLDAVRQPIELDGHEVVVSTSLGISLFPLDGDDANALMANADTAMYHAKSAGGNAARFYNKPMRSAAASRFSMEMALRRALERDQFLLAYQPKLSLATRQVSGFEALVRWNHPELGLVSPLEFIPLAEETGLIFAIGEWVLRTACSQTAEWRRTIHPSVRVAVNVSARQFREPTLAEQLSAILKDSGLHPSALDLEITESAIMGNPALAQETTRAMRRLGCTVSIDDFGTGYSSLAYLKQLEVDCLKIDRAFISGLPRSADDSAIVTAVITMASSLNMQVVAEGVETNEQLMHLQSIGCHEVQGYLISRPVLADAVPLLLARGFDSLLRSTAA